MGILDRFRQRQWPGEQEIEDIYLSMYQTLRGMSQSEARATVRQMIQQAKKEAEEQGTAQIPPGFGDRILAEQSTNDRFRTMLQAKRAEGVRDDDMRWWWNLVELERQLMMIEDNMTRLAAFTQYREEGLTSDEAAARVRRAFVIYGSPSDTTHSSGDDRPLPCELRDRVNVWLQRVAEDGGAELKAQADAASSFNALIRRKIRDGSL